VCGNVYCPYGMMADVNGCTTCQCNPPPACTPADCGPSPGAAYVCPDGSTAGATCRRGADDACTWTIVPCPNSCATEVMCNIACRNGYQKDPNGCLTCNCLPDGDCATYTDGASCQADLRCTWLTPGCTAPALATEGCYARSAIGCTSDSDCTGGLTCLKRVVNPCAGAATCAACGVTQTICL
jgi:hypothetical protein